MSANTHSNFEHTQEKIIPKEEITYFGVTDFRGQEEKFGIKPEDRMRHMYVIGKTGMGKSTLLENMAIQDIQNGNGLCFVDPHGTTAEKLLKYIPENRMQDVIYFAPFDTKYPISLNILEYVEADKRHLVSSGLMDTFKKVFGEDVFSGRMVYLLNNAFLSLLENEGESLLGINRIFSDKEYRKKIISNVKDPALLSFWNDEYAKYDDKYVKEATAAIQNKIGQFIMIPMIRNIVGQIKSSFDMREIMDTKKILICNFSIGQTGSENVNLIGSLLITKIYLAAMSRANLSYEELKKAPPFFFYVDEFQNFVNDSFAQILSQARKYNLGLIIANQYVEEQLTDKVRAAIFGNVGTLVSFRIGAADAEEIEKEFAPNFTADDLVNLGLRQIYLRLSIDGVGSKPFSARTMTPILDENIDYVPAIMAMSRVTFAKEKEKVEEEIATWYKRIVTESATTKVTNVAERLSSRNVRENNFSNSSRDYDTKKEMPYKKPSPIIDRSTKSYTREAVQDTPKKEQEEKKKEIEKLVDKNENTKPKQNTSLRNALSSAMSINLKEEKGNIKKVNKEDLQKILDEDN